MFFFNFFFFIFDGEIILIFTLIMIMKITSYLNYMIISSFLLFILLLGLHHEWSQGALNWTI